MRRVSQRRTGADLVRRPKKAPRYGDKVEAHFGRINQLVVNQLPGNTQNDKLGRSSSRNMRSAAHARHDLIEFIGVIEKSLMGILNDRPVGDEVATPREQFEASQQQFHGVARSISTTSDILALTAIPAQPRTRQISHTHGIRFQKRRYVGAGIRAPELDGLSVDVRWEPYNPCIIYAHIGDTWERLICSGYQALENVGHEARVAELYLRFDTATATRLAKEKADCELVTLLYKGLEKPPIPVTVEPESDEKCDLFADARQLSLEKLREGAI